MMAVTTNPRLTGASGATQEATVTLTAADLAVLDSVPFELVPAPGAGKAIVGITAVFVADAPTPAVNNGATYLSIDYDPASAQIAATEVDLLLDGGDTYATTGSSTGGASYKNGSLDNAAVMLGLDAGSLLIPGAIATSSIGAAGTGYVALETVTRGDATIRIDTVGGSGEVLTYTVTVAGTNNIIGNTQATTGGSGADFTIDIDTLDYSVNPMTLTVKTLYTVVDV